MIYTTSYRTKHRPNTTQANFTGNSWEIEAKHPDSGWWTVARTKTEEAALEKMEDLKARNLGWRPY